MADWPIVVLPVGPDDETLDACLAALDAGTPAGTRVWLADDGRVGPRGYAIIEHWLARTALKADYTRRQRSIGELAHLDEVLVACAEADVAVLAADAVPLPGWLERMVACLDGDGAIATVTPWSNAGEAAGWPRIGEIAPMPADLERLGRAAAAMPAAHPELPAAVGHAVLLRGAARQRASGLDTASYGSWYAGLIDLSLRLSGLGWRNVLCESAFVARAAEGVACEGDMDRLAIRWPDWHARMAGFLMRDPLRASREQLAGLLATIGPPAPQPDLFAGAGAATQPGAAGDGVAHGLAHGLAHGRDGERLVRPAASAASGRAGPANAPAPMRAAAAAAGPAAPAAEGSLPAASGRQPAGAMAGLSEPSSGPAGLSAAGPEETVETFESVGLAGLAGLAGSAGSAGPAGSAGSAAPAAPVEARRANPAGTLR